MTDTGGLARPPAADRIALVQCRGSKFGPRRRLAKKYDNCMAAAAAMPPKICRVGCLGLGDCAAVCPTGALIIGADLVARVDVDLCVGCGLCVKACPRRVIALQPAWLRAAILCRSSLPDQEQKEICFNGCLGCGRCLTACTSQAITVSDHLARIDAQACRTCGLCAEWCPRGSAVFRGISGKFTADNPLADL